MFNSDFKKGALLYGIAYLIFCVAIYLFTKDKPHSKTAGYITIGAMLILSCIHLYRAFTGNHIPKVVIGAMGAYALTYAFFIVKINDEDIIDVLKKIVSKGEQLLIR